MTSLYDQLGGCFQYIHACCKFSTPLPYLLMGKQMLT
jgi:hypothetical protein